MWTAQNRRRYDRSQLRYASDLTDDEWAHVSALIAPAKPGGNPEKGVEMVPRRRANPFQRKPLVKISPWRQRPRSPLKPPKPSVETGSPPPK